MPDLTIPHTFTNGPGNIADADEVNANFIAIRTVVNDLDDANLGSGLAEDLGVSQTGTVRRGKTIISTEETRTNTAFGLMTTPDRVQSVRVEDGGLLYIGYQAQWRNTVAGAAEAAIFIGSDQLKIAASAGPLTESADGPEGGTNYQPLSSWSGGLITTSEGSAAASADVTTGQALGVARAGNMSFTLSGVDQVIVDPFAAGGFCVVFGLPAGSYDVSVQFKASSGSVLVRNRSLWVKSEAF